MSPLTKDSFNFNHGLWECKVNYESRAISLLVDGDEKLFDGKENLTLANDFISELSRHVNLAKEFAIRSEFSEEIELVEKLVIHSVHLHSWVNTRIWFVLGENSDRMLGVHCDDYKLVSLYCDPA